MYIYNVSFTITSCCIECQCANIRGDIKSQIKAIAESHIVGWLVYIMTGSLIEGTRIIRKIIEKSTISFSSK